jgi:hypothetical protein
LEEIMAKTIADMTAIELRQLVSSVVEEKLVELLGDPDEGMVLRENVRARLLRQKQAVAKGERGESLQAVARRLNLA